MTKYASAENLEFLRKRMTSEQKEKGKILEEKGFSMLTNQVVISANKSQVAVPYSDGYGKSGFILPSGKFVMPSKGKTSVRLDGNLNIVY